MPLPSENQYLSDDDPNKFIAKMGAEAIASLLEKLDLDELSYHLEIKHQMKPLNKEKQKL